MLKVLFTFLVILLSINAISQSQFKGDKKEPCKKNEIEFITGEFIPLQYFNVAQNSFKKKAGIDSIEKLSPKHIRLMTRFANKFNCCAIFVDFKGVVAKVTAKNGKNLQEKSVFFYIIRPLL